MKHALFTMYLQILSQLSGFYSKSFLDLSVILSESVFCRILIVMFMEVDTIYIEVRNKRLTIGGFTKIEVIIL